MQQQPQQQQQQQMPEWRRGRKRGPLLLRGSARCGAAAAVLSAVVAVARGHPLCLDSAPPFDASAVAEGDLCGMYGTDAGTCCPSWEFNEGLEQEYAETLPNWASPECEAMHRELTCGRCHPWSQHLFEGYGGSKMNLCGGWCQAYRDACGLADDFCDSNSIRTASGEDEFYCYPFDLEAKAGGDAGNFVEAFGQGFGGDMTIVGIVFRPDTDWPWLVDQAGRIVEVQGRPGVDEYPPTSAIVDIGELPDVYPLGHSGKQTEQGLLGLAFHPTFGQADAPGGWFFFVHYYTRAPGFDATRVSRMTFRDGKGVDELILVEIPQNWGNHNGGWLSFPPSHANNPQRDSFTLFASSGDGGGAYDTAGNAQRDGSLRGKILTFEILRDGSVVAGPNEYAKGLRNPWRCSFTRDDRLFCADVGQDSQEWLSEVREGSNLGWPCYEGTNVATGCEVPNRTWPVYSYCHWAGCAAASGRSITGGFFYRGSKYADILSDMYIFGDFMSWNFYALRFNGDKTRVEQDFWLAYKGGTHRAITTFGEDSSGELIFAVIGADSSSKIFLMPCGSLCEGASLRSKAEPVVAELPAVLESSAARCAPLWHQCGGRFYGGATNCCNPDDQCIVLDEYYSACHSCKGEWEVCGGKEYKGATCCEQGLFCNRVDVHYSYCARE